MSASLFRFISVFGMFSLNYSYRFSRVKQKLTQPNYLLIKYRGLGIDWRTGLGPEFIETVNKSRFLSQSVIAIYNTLRTVGFNLKDAKYYQSAHWVEMKNLGKYFNFINHTEKEMNEIFGFNNEIIELLYDKVKKAKVEFKQSLLKSKDLSLLKDKLRNTNFKRIYLESKLQKLPQTEGIAEQEKTKVKKEIEEANKKLMYYKENYNTKYTELENLVHKAYRLVDFN